MATPQYRECIPNAATRSQQAYGTKQDDSSTRAPFRSLKHDARPIKSREVTVVVRHFLDRKSRLKGRSPSRTREGTGEVEDEWSYADLYAELQKLALASLGGSVLLECIDGTIFIDAPRRETVAVKSEEGWTEHRHLLGKAHARIWFDFNVAFPEMSTIKPTWFSKNVDKARDNVLKRIATVDAAIRKEKEAQQEYFSKHSM